MVNKCLTILLNILIWDQHANTQGILSLFVCLAGGIIYKQAPMKREVKQTADAANIDLKVQTTGDGDEDEEKAALVDTSTDEKRN